MHKVYAARVKDRQVLSESSSGGMFVALSDQILHAGGAVVCAVYDYQNYNTKYTLIETTDHRNSALGSKYMQSFPGEVFDEAVEWLSANPNKKILFVGMGCQAAGFKNYVTMKGMLDRVYIVDIICHGSPSPMLWKEYAKLIEKKYGGRITYLTFKDKRKGWKQPTAYALINGNEVDISDYVRLFYSRVALRPSCHVCPYACIERQTDLTIGDYWGIDTVIPDFYDPEGNSLVIVHNDRGLKLFEMIKDSIEYRASNATDCLQPNLERPTPVSEFREKFWLEYHEQGMKYIMKKYYTISIQSKIKNKLFKIFGGGQVTSLYVILFVVSAPMRGGMHNELVTA